MTIFVISLDKKQQQVRKETATVIMEAEKLSQEVKHLQNEVDKLREVTSSTSECMHMWMICECATETALL